MTEPSARPRFWQIYRDQYRQISSSRSEKILRVIRPIGLVAATFVYPHSPVVGIVLFAVGIVVVASSILWSRRRRRRLPVPGQQEHPVGVDSPR